MFLDIKSKLDLYKKDAGVKAERPKSKGPDIHQLLDGLVCTNEAGSFFSLEKRYPLTYFHGGYTLGQAANMDMTPISVILKDDIAHLTTNDMLFFDTETTGLAGGTGTVAFLVGIGYFGDDCFIIKQFLMRDYDEECAMLTSLNQALKQKKLLVSFNGKSFDWNLLLTRFTANRMRVGIKAPIHIDLLYPARAIWKHKLENCRLSSLEENILGIKRHDDIPGALIPEVYFKYLSDRNAFDMMKVIIHNENDVISMASLMLRINSLLSDPLSSARGLAELYGTGTIFDRLNEHETAIKCYFCCINSKYATLKEMSLKRLIRIYKKNRDYHKAIEFLEMLLNESKLPNIPIMIELAKQYEHRVKNIAKALEIVRTAIESCHKASFSRNLYYSDLKARADRLERKIRQQ